MTWSKFGKLIEDFHTLTLDTGKEYFTVRGKVTHIFINKNLNNKFRQISSLTLRPVSHSCGTHAVSLQFEGDWQVVAGFLQKEDVICVSNPVVQGREYDSLDEYPVLLVLNNCDRDGSQGLGLSVLKQDTSWEELIFIESCEVHKLKDRLVSKGKGNVSTENQTLFLKASQLRQLSKRYLRKVDRPLARSRKYSKLADLGEFGLKHRIVNVYGVVAGFRALRPTKGKDYVCETTLIDPTQYSAGQEITLVLFSKSLSKTIPVKSLGDIVRLNNVLTQKHGSKLQLVVTYEESCVELIGGDVDEDIAVVASTSSSGPEWEDEDLHIVRQLREWARLHFSSIEGSKPSLVEKVDFRNVFCSVGKVDLVCRIESVVEDKIDAETYLLVWDGVSYRDVEFSQRQCFLVVLSCAAKRSQYVFQCPLVENSWILLKDIWKQVQEPNNEICIIFDIDRSSRTCSTMIYLKEWMYRVQQKLGTYLVSSSIAGERLRHKLVDEEKKDSLTELNESTNAPVNSVAHIRASPKAFQSSLLLSAKLVGFRPRDIRDFTVPCCRHCHKYILQPQEVASPK
ncbi:POT1-like telomere end-binding protein [Galdieria sulphuraria]|uniref:POT1-like telomere end-binding protein n=1 Tax=Galdieria sulphuraria TaxID=130081 RepID=M2W532_GALSU|nr:POT1-like telomere end-binding protein [Galdieria sulphuraria]EME30836.1 POT1-like telomere end-binding protein [Galdieria sulphuraria]|eukprot:XP_005707356.1 POT1-like telomere end-binding protein [Galdieria sulphuraria]